MVNRASLRRWSAGWSIGLVLGGLLFIGMSGKARAYDTPPHRAVRLSYVQGSVTVERADNTASDPALINMPLAVGVRVSTGEDGQAEIEFEDGSMVRLTPNSALSLNALSVDESGNFRTQVAVIHGLAYAELRATAKFAYSVDADGDVISPVENATVRIDLDKPPAVISVFDGAVHVERADSQEAVGYQSDVRAGETLTRDSADASRYFLSQQVVPDSWDEWNESRDQAAADEAANQTTARDGYAGDQGYGWSDLDANGTWYNVPGQGMVWQPNVALDESFDPYGYGSWVDYSGVGYVWASGYAWGWTPFRCGNWSYWGSFGWGWQPGSGCGLGGWGFGAGGYVINILRPPLHYPFPHPPSIGSGSAHPVHIGKPARLVVASESAPRSPRVIDGETAEPLRQAGGYTVRGVSPVGSSLRRDYPVDKDSHQPVLGVVAIPGDFPSVVTEPRPSALRPSPSGSSARPMSSPQAYRPAPQSHPAPAAPRSAPTSTPAPPSAPSAPGSSAKK